jgi:hypothetical protein
MKCKVFDAASSTYLEKNINEWLDLNKDKELLNIQYSIGKGDYSTIFSCIVFGEAEI